MRYTLFILFLFSFHSPFAQTKTDDMLQKILSQNTNPAFQKVLRDKDSFRLKIIYTKINRDKNNIPSFTNYSFGTDSDVYFYPASTVKLPLALISLEILNAMRARGVNKYTAVEFDSSHISHILVSHDGCSEHGIPPLAQ